MQAEVAEVADPQGGAVEANGADPLDVLSDVPSLDDLEILRANLGDDGAVLRGVGADDQNSGSGSEHDRRKN